MSSKLLTPVRPIPAPSDLTKRQIDIVRLFAKSYTAVEIAAIMDLSVKTVESHKYTIYRILRIEDMAALTRYAIRHGLVSADE